VAEEAADRCCIGACSATQKTRVAGGQRLRLRLKNIATRHVVRLGDKLLALWEAELTARR